MRASSAQKDDFSTDFDSDVPSLSKFIYDKLYAAILEGSLKPGQLLRQEELAARFNTSRVPLREALQHLQAKGMVALRPRRGFAVTSLDERELLGVLQLRMLVEGYAGYVATLGRTDEDVASLESCLKALEKFPSTNMTDSQRAKWAALNRRFHDTLFASARNDELKHLTANLSAKVQPYILLELSSTQDLVDGPHFHREIFDAFKAGDAATVAMLSRMHCELTAQRFLEVLQSRDLVTDLTIDQIVDLGPAASMERRTVAVPGTRAASAAPRSRATTSRPVAVATPATAAPITKVAVASRRSATKAGVAGKKVKQPV